jgi:putative ABC transport system permease protein
MNLQLDSRYNKPEQRRAMFLNFLAHLRAIPGVLEAGAGSDIPLDHYESVTIVEVKGYGKPKNMIDGRCITPGYLTAFGMKMLAGRPFSDEDMRARKAVAIVNQAFVKAFMAGRDPLETEVRSGSNLDTRRWSTVVGVVGDRRHSSLEETPRPEYYEPYSPSYDTANFHFAVRSLLPSGQVAAAARSALNQLDPTLALDDLRTMDQRMAVANAKRRFQTIMLGVFGFVAFLLALGGIFGVLSYSVRQRTKEIGLRLALGASPAQVLRMIMGEGLSAVVAGLVIGAGLALSLSRFIGSWLYGVAVSDPPTYALLALSVLLVASVACLLPAFDAMRIDPAVAIRDE